MHSTAIAERIVTKKLSCPNFTKDNKRVLGCSSFWLEIVLDGQLSSVSGDYGTGVLLSWHSHAQATKFF